MSGLITILKNKGKLIGEKDNIRITYKGKIIRITEMNDKKRIYYLHKLYEFLTCCITKRKFQ